MSSLLDDQWAWYCAAMLGTPPAVRDGTPYSGYYRHRWNDKRPLETSEMKVGGPRSTSQIMWEAVGIWRDEDGKLVCQRGFPQGTRNIRGELAKPMYQGGLTMTPEAIDELWAACSKYPISYELFQAVMYEGAQWPDDILKDKGALKAAGSVPGHNQPPEETPAEDPAPETVAAVAIDETPAEESLTPDQVAQRKLKAIEKAAGEYLAQIGGKVETEAQSHVVADYAIKARDIAQQSDKDREAEKKPHLDAGRAIDAKWKIVITEAKAVKERLSKPVDEWQRAETARRQAEADAEAERLRAELDAEAARNPGIEVPREIETRKVEPIRSGTAGRAISQRTNKVVHFTNRSEAFLFAIERVSDENSPLWRAAISAVDQLLRVGIKVPGAELVEETKAA